MLIWNKFLKLLLCIWKFIFVLRQLLVLRQDLLWTSWTLRNNVLRRVNFLWASWTLRNIHLRHDIEEAFCGLTLQEEQGLDSKASGTARTCNGSTCQCPAKRFWVHFCNFLTSCNLCLFWNHSVLSLSTHRLSNKKVGGRTKTTMVDKKRLIDKSDTLGHLSQSWGPQAHLSQQHLQQGHRTGGHRVHLSIISWKTGLICAEVKPSWKQNISKLWKILNNLLSETLFNHTTECFTNIYLYLR